MPTNSICARLSNCSACKKATNDILVHRSFIRGKHFPAEKCVQNCMIFILKGELLVNSDEYPGTNLKKGDFILQAINSKIELLALTDVEYIVFWFNKLPVVCEERYHEIITNSEAPITYSALKINDKLNRLLTQITEYLEEHNPCDQIINLKSQELVFVITCYYPIHQLKAFFYPISKYIEHFHVLVMQNYHKVKTVEEFAHLGGYSTTTFRRLFKNMYGEPVYEWILNQKKKAILDELQNTNQKVGEVSKNYGFDSLSHFAHFCKSSFGYSPRELRTRTAQGEKIQIR